ncbi:hypothetical protein ACFWAR_27080 [Streptomyces sp. NPDC059917]|uniref:hypothetical protein n=1 Tax=Streptomyces sp. NPDC059917 TaxID=3347002 RepID=UPI00365960EA
MRKLTTLATATTGAALVLAVGAGTASADSVISAPWDTSVTGASSTGTVSTAWVNNAGTVTAKGTLKVTDPKACYTVSVGVGFIGKPRGPQIWVKAPQKQCGPGTIDVSATMGPYTFWDGPWVRICKDGDTTTACKG